jgi:hypothetical protein
MRHRAGRAPMRLATAAMLLGLVGCWSFTAKDEQLAPDGTEGLVVVSTRTTDTCGGSSVNTLVHYEGLLPDGGIKGGVFLFTNPLLSHHFTDPPGYLYIQKFPAGEYRLTTIKRTSTRGAMDLPALDSRFTVRPGKTVYLGELRADFPSCQTYQTSVSDQRQRDRALFDQRVPSLRSESFDHQILRIAKAQR